MKAVGLFATALSIALLSSGCGYRIVRNSDVTAKRFAHDSASIQSLEQELAALRLRCRVDSIRLANELAIKSSEAATIVTVPEAPPSDSLLKARTAEVATLKEQLAKVSKELDRIKRRLANPRP